MNILSIGSHGVLEYDQVKLWSDLGYDVFSPGGYEAPRAGESRMRPDIPTAPDHPELRTLCHAQRVLHAGDDISWAIDWAKADLHLDLVDWADTVIVDCYPDRWLVANFHKFTGKRVIWRTIGQSNPILEEVMAPYRGKGLEVVRCSPAERRALEPTGRFAGEDAVIRFGKDPADWYGWTGEDARVLNFTQHNREPHTRDEWVNWGFWEAATAGLPAVFGGPNSELVGGLGSCGYDEMRVMLRQCRAYLYTGTQPASYTLGLVEAMMTGIPVVSIGPSFMWIPELFEAATSNLREMTPIVAADACFDDAAGARAALMDLLAYPDKAETVSSNQRARAIALFSTDTIGRQWLDYLGTPASVTWQTGEAVTA